jgi:hypothetical protein
MEIDVVPKASRAVVIRRFSLSEAPLGLFKFISDYFVALIRDLTKVPFYSKLNDIGPPFKFSFK